MSSGLCNYCLWGWPTGHARAARRPIRSCSLLTRVRPSGADAFHCMKKSEDPLLDQDDRPLALAFSLLYAASWHILKNCIPSLLMQFACSTAKDSRWRGRGRRSNGPLTKPRRIIDGTSTEHRWNTNGTTTGPEVLLFPQIFLRRCIDRIKLTIHASEGRHRGFHRAAVVAYVLLIFGSCKTAAGHTSPYDGRATGVGM